MLRALRRARCCMSLLSFADRVRDRRRFSFLPPFVEALAREVHSHALPSHARSHVAGELAEGGRVAR
jgi:hypothetical protein